MTAVGSLLLTHRSVSALMSTFATLTVGPPQESKVAVIGYILGIHAFLDIILIITHVQFWQYSDFLSGAMDAKIKPNFHLKRGL